MLDATSTRRGDVLEEAVEALLRGAGGFLRTGSRSRDKAARFGLLRDEAVRLGGVALFAVLGGLGWRRVSDALGPVVRDTDGRVFTLATLEELLTVDPLPRLVGGADPSESSPRWS